MEEIKQLVREINAPRVLIVGGWVRDFLLGVESKDVDLEVYGLDLDAVAENLVTAGHKVDLVGKQFGVLKVDNRFDVSVPRRDSKNGVGHKGFTAVCDPTMTPKEAAARRDFTVNSIAFDPMTGEWLDPFNGVDDLREGVLRATSEAFVEDPLRVLRGMQFSARFGFDLDDWTYYLCETMGKEFHALPAERVYEEWKKWALKGRYPGYGLLTLVSADWLQYFPELAALDDCPQEPEWHPEGDVWIHTLHVCDAAAEIAERDKLNDFDREVLMFAALCHDFGKPETTVKEESGRITSKRHAKEGVKHARAFLERMKAPQAVVEAVCKLTQYHLFHSNFGTSLPPAKTVRRLANKLAPVTVELWAKLVEADASGRPPMPACNPVEGWLDIAEEVHVKDSAPKPLVMGRHLITLGVKPGPGMGAMLKDLFEKQLDGEFETVEDGLKLVEL